MRKKLKSILGWFGFHIDPEQKTAFDVVCGMELKSFSIKQASPYKGETYYFCSESCKDHFDADPKKYIG
ncbi:MAG: Heavy metal translocating P-type ATPase [Candidatus Jorgensenbacteria bacterium GW2011_GWA1_48_13]|uniref:Heavy metal translocating P-type ATPase n=1 Tax=Candidatus Jorgensenbacteria bacterium GW2011_GWB1_50_10 TaxID=1618665 RepID=A0A0G1WA08_9BACT|nr:MAG: Heavy metal translocating P-type ATPase [Parcubacteria group bacterium GW2011_GWC1_45_9]KKU94278.1 MAG: Heavy metal translocating P-type ATPase [Candidatus Jorgensenbacteria bacterium GW2011_GWA1_48_13]KKW15450.1 MAG: Heavy metal translocating P-type ATPase [Candidatus Jorgensenbacteria bacterium GW2011_GWB1_50_10]